MPGLLQAGCAVHGRRLIERGIDRRDRRHIDDGVPAHLLPVVRQIQKRAEQRNVRQEVHPRAAEIADDRIDHAAVGEEVGEDCGNDDPAEEVRECVDRLIHALELRAAHFVDQQRENDRRRELEDQSRNIDFKRIADGLHGRRRFEDAGEVIHAHPLGTPDAQARIVLLERENNAAHRRIMEDSEKHNAWNQHQIEITRFPHIMAKTPEFCPHLSSPFTRNGTSDQYHYTNQKYHFLFHFSGQFVHFSGA